MRISDWSSDVCSSDLSRTRSICFTFPCLGFQQVRFAQHFAEIGEDAGGGAPDVIVAVGIGVEEALGAAKHPAVQQAAGRRQEVGERHLEDLIDLAGLGARSEEHTSELQSLMRISYAAFCLKKQ